jgi:hypothetical protein
MAKIHTHYDNLKVARGAPQEVVRAAYKALSQKYHPDKNPGDEKAARIMAIVNTAYNILSDPMRRKEHDEWIAAEEWEVAWLESSGEEGARARGETWDEPPQRRRRRRLLGDPRWWVGLFGGATLGAACVWVLLQQPGLLPAAFALGARAEPVARVSANPAPRVSTVPALDPDVWAASGVPKGPPPPVKALAVTQLLVPARQNECDTDLAAPNAPNGEAWPEQSGYIPGYPLGNNGREMTVVVDNSANAAAVFVKIHDLERRLNVRHAYVLGNGMLTIDGLAAGRYEVRYQNIVGPALRADCAGRAARRTEAGF